MFDSTTGGRGASRKQRHDGDTFGRARRQPLHYSPEYMLQIRVRFSLGGPFSRAREQFPYFLLG